MVVLGIALDRVWEYAMVKRNSMLCLSFVGQRV
jgi:hypothetical protein